MLKVAHVIDTLNMGGAQRLLVTFAKESRELPLTMRLASLRNDEHSSIASQLATLDVKIDTFPSSRLLSPVRIRRLANWFRRERPDVIHTHLTYSNIAGLLAARAVGIPVVSTLHNVRARKQRPATQALEACLLRLGAQRIVAVGHVVARAYQDRLGRRDITVIPNAVSPPQRVMPGELTSLRASLAGSADRPFLIAAGRLTHQKGFDDLLAAFAEVCQTFPEAFLVIAGSGEQEPELSQQIRNLRLDIGRLLAAADLFVSSSRWEGMPVSLLEAMAAGTPVVATAVGETPEFLSEEMGILVRPGDPTEFASAISSMLTNPARREAMGLQASQYVAAHFEASVWARKLFALYCELGSEAGMVEILS
jgi:glycosyltransferase involved in cell wall biosynthesis